MNLRPGLPDPIGCISESRGGFTHMFNMLWYPREIDALQKSKNVLKSRQSYVLSQGLSQNLF